MASRRAAIVYDDIFLEHRTERHPECPERLVAITGRLKEAGLWEGRPRVETRLASDEELERAHEVAHVQRIETTNARGGGWLDPDTYMSARSAEVARAAAGAGICAVDAVLDGRAARAIALVRPPGHHATRNQAMGFCLYDNIAIAARHLREARGLSKVAILDWDVHHGNGTQDIFWDDPSVLYLSFHRYPFYPGTGAADETGGPAASGTKINVPLPASTPRAEYLDRWQTVLEERVRPFEPEFILVSAGFDAYHGDPIGGLGLEAMDFATLTHAVRELARETAQGRVVSFLEGGYALDELGTLVEAHLAALDDEGDS